MIKPTNKQNNQYPIPIQNDNVKDLSYIDMFRGNCFDPKTKKSLGNHSIAVGKKCAYCMDCGKIIIEFEDKKDFKKLMNPFEPYE